MNHRSKDINIVLVTPVSQVSTAKKKKSLKFKWTKPATQQVGREFTMRAKSVLHYHQHSLSGAVVFEVQLHGNSSVAIRRFTTMWIFNTAAGVFHVVSMGPLVLSNLRHGECQLSCVAIQSAE